MKITDIIANLNKLQALVIRSAMDNIPVSLEEFRDNENALYRALGAAIVALEASKTYPPGITMHVTDVQTGEYPDLEKIALEEEWAKNLIYCDMQGFAIDEEGYLMLADECGNVAYCPPDRFTYEISVLPNNLPEGGE